MKKIAIDLVPIRVGEGGTGSGIWTYARELLLVLDQMDFQGLEIHCLVNRGHVEYLPLKRIKIHVFSAGEKNIIKRLFWVHVQLPLWCLKNGIDLLHKVATETPFFCSAKRVTTIHDFYYEYLMENRQSDHVRFYERLENLYFSFVTRLCFKKSSRLIAVSNATRCEAIQRYPDAKNRIAVIHHGAPMAQPLANSQQLSANSSSSSFDSKLQTGNSNPDKLEIRKQLIADSQQPTAKSPASSSNAQCPAPDAFPFTILCVAKFMEHKGQHLLIEAFVELLERYPELTGKTLLRLRGFHNDVDYFARVCRLVESSRFASCMHLEGFNPADSVEDIYHNANLVVLLSSYEGFGLPVLEAQGMGVPVLCSDLPVLQEVGGEGAAYVKREDVMQVAETLCRFVTDTGFYEKQRLMALDNVERFSWDDAARKTLAVYSSVGSA
jgi:glycosyltransferase involved in cell wall biosynthesis